MRALLTGSFAVCAAIAAALWFLIDPVLFSLHHPAFYSGDGMSHGFLVKTIIDTGVVPGAFAVGGHAIWRRPLRLPVQRCVEFPPDPPACTFQRRLDRCRKPVLPCRLLPCGSQRLYRPVANGRHIGAGGRRGIPVCAAALSLDARRTIAAGFLCGRATGCVAVIRCMARHTRAAQLSAQVSLAGIHCHRRGLWWRLLRVLLGFSRCRSRYRQGIGVALDSKGDSRDRDLVTHWICGRTQRGAVAALSCRERTQPRGGGTTSRRERNVWAETDAARSSSRAAPHQRHARSGAALCRERAPAECEQPGFARSRGNCGFADSCADCVAPPCRSIGCAIVDAVSRRDGAVEHPARHHRRHLFLIAHWVSPIIRGYDRISIFVAFVSLADSCTHLEDGWWSSEASASQIRGCGNRIGACRRTRPNAAHVQHSAGPRLCQRPQVRSRRREQPSPWHDGVAIARPAVSRSPIRLPIGGLWPFSRLPQFEFAALELRCDERARRGSLDTCAGDSSNGQAAGTCGAEWLRRRSMSTAGESPIKALLSKRRCAQGWASRSCKARIECWRFTDCPLPESRLPRWRVCWARSTLQSGSMFRS